MKLISQIRSKSRREYEDLASSGRAELRVWIQEHGEQAALLAFLGGIVAMLFFRAVVFLLVLATALAALVWYLAKPTSELVDESVAKTTPTDSGGDGQL